MTTRDDTGSNNLPLEDPFEWFDRWYADAESLDLDHPNAVSLSTVTEEGHPRSRTVLLKSFDREGFVFYTNYESDKGREIEATGRAAMLFYWRPLGRQIRIEGETERLAPEASDAYFESRPRGSRIGAWASDQSRPLDSREDLETRVEAYREKFEGGDVPRPDHWGGIRLVPDRFLFWREGADRLHDRWRFEPDGDDGWTCQRLNP
jgi:pyridoxamine 5'-phosphate oxidase